MDQCENGSSETLAGLLKLPGLVNLAVNLSLSLSILRWGSGTFGFILQD